jgi:5'(3')-deoxyribonucleotidase
MTKTIYIDMDGVVADWESLAKEVLGTQPRDINGRWPDYEWQKVKAIEHFYYKLNTMPRADELMALARRFRDELGWRLYMLTALPHDDSHPEAAADKYEWMYERWPDVPVRLGPYSHDKWRHASPGDILVDDRPSNIQEWQEAGGVAVHVTSDYALALDQLHELFKSNSN